MPSRWEIHRADFGAPMGHGPAKERPALVLSADSYNLRGQAVTVAPFTSTDRPLYPGELLIEPEGSGLRKRSILQVHLMYTMDQRRLRGFIGRLEDPDYQRAVEVKLAEILGLRLGDP
ncbi:MAG: type II toxin-antitoxin system PemK/MazF family toxin [Candidatus Dormibacteria bacterium]